ncbi:MAG: Holliday junction branch migration protein RuvA [Clostridia bacterium]
MFAYLKGNIQFKSEEYVVMEVNGIGYKIFMSKKSIDELEEDREVKVYTYLKVREDDVSLFGFKTNEELHMFELLISVGGIGAKSAITILSNITPSRFALAVITNDVNSLKKLQGIGPKTAQRIILELKDKIKTEEAILSNDNTKLEEEANSEEDQEELIQALQVLGYRRYEINKVLSKIKSENLEDKIREALQYLAK